MERALQILQIPPELQQRVCLDQKIGVFSNKIYGFHVGTYRCRCMSIQSEKPAVWDVELSRKDLNGGGKIHIYKSSPMWFCMVSLWTFFWVVHVFWGGLQLRLRVPPLQKGLSILEICLRSTTHRITNSIIGWWLVVRLSMHLFQKFEHDVEVRWRRWSEHYLNFNRKGILFEENSISKKESFQSFYVTSWFNVEVSFFCSSVSIWQIMVDTSTEGLQLVVRKEELEQSTGEHSPGVSLPGNSGLLSTFQDIRCFYHWNCSLDELEKWCGNCQNDSSSLWVLYLCCDRNKDPNYIIAVVNVLEDRTCCLSGASTRNFLQSSF